MEKHKIFIIIVLILLMSAFAAYYFIFNIYEVTFLVTPKSLYADNRSKVLIEVIPINSLGQRAPMRTVKAEFTIIEGAGLVDIIEDNSENGKMLLKAGYKTGKVVVLIKPDKSLLPSEIEINIYPNIALK